MLDSARFSESYEASIQVGGAVLEFLGLTKADVLALKRSVSSLLTCRDITGLLGCLVSNAGKCPRRICEIGRFQ